MGKSEIVDIIARTCNDILLLEQQAYTPELTGREWDELLELASSQGLLPIIIQSLNAPPPPQWRRANGERATAAMDWRNATE